MIPAYKRFVLLFFDMQYELFSVPLPVGQYLYCAFLVRSEETVKFK